MATTRTTSTSCGSRRPSTGRAAWPSSRPRARLEDRRRDAEGAAADGRLPHGADLYALTRFGRWDEMLKEPEPPAFNAALRRCGITRGAGARRAPAGAERRELTKQALMADPSMKQPLFSPNTAAGAVAPAVGGARGRDRRRARTSTRPSRTSNGRAPRGHARRRRNPQDARRL